MDKGQICAVIVSFNSPETLTACINSSLNQVDTIIVIDNSSIYFKDFIRKLNYPNKILFVFNETNKGLGYALNQGIKYSLDNSYTWTLLLDQDSELSENMVHNMMQSYENLDNKTKEETVLITPIIFDRYFKNLLPPIVTTKLFNKKIINPKTDCFIHFNLTSGSLLKNKAISKVGFMNEKYFIDYIDFDYCFRIINNNYKILLCKNALLYHSLGEKKHKAFFNFTEHTSIRVYYQTRNRLFTLVKYGKKYKSFLYAEIFRFISKLFKILILESNKKEKLKMYFKGIYDFMKDMKNS